MSTLKYDLRGRSVLITGASRGLGLATARLLAVAGANVAMSARDPAALDSAAGQVRELAGSEQRIVPVPMDLANAAAIPVLFERMIRQFGPIDVLINNGAIQGTLGSFETRDFAAWREVFEVDFFAAARLIQLAIPVLRSRGGGKIVNLSGGGATGPRPDVSAYACAKTALVRLTETLAEELRPWRIDVNAVAPGVMNTRMLEETIAAGPSGAAHEYAAAVERARNGTGASPDKAAELVVFLASPASDGITGRLISAVWDDWQTLPARRDDLAKSDVFTLRRIVPKDRPGTW